MVINLRNESAAELLNDIENGFLAKSLLPWVPLMHGGGDTEILKRWKKIAESEPDVERRELYRDLALIFAELSKKLVLWQKTLGEPNMLESQLILGWMKKGEDRGVVKTAREFVIGLIGLRFGDPIPEDLMLAVEGTNDPAILKQWNILAATADSLAQIRKAMKGT